MSVRSLELLKLLELLKPNGEVADLDDIPNEELYKKIDYYVEKRRESLESELDSLAGDPARFSGLVSSISASNSVVTLLPYSVVYGAILADDPLFKLVVPGDEHDRASNIAIGLAPEYRVEKSKIANELMYFSRLRPLIEIGVLNVQPLYSIHKPSGPRPFRFSEDGFKSLLPDYLYEYVQKNAVVRPVNRFEDAIFIPYEQVTEPVTGIAISFPDDEPVNSDALYFFARTRFEGRTDSGGIIVSNYVDWSNPPDLSDFNTWVAQSINQTAYRRMVEVSQELCLADSLNTTYITESKFESNLFGQPMGSQKPQSDDVLAVKFLKANLPVMRNLTPEGVAKLRESNPSQFEKFHSTLLHVSSELSGIQDDFEGKAQRLFASEVEPQIREINESWGKLIMSSAAGIVTAGTTLGLALVATPLLPLASSALFSTLLGSAVALPSVTEFLSSRRKPAYIWSKIVD